MHNTTASRKRDMKFTVPPAKIGNFLPIQAQIMLKAQSKRHYVRCQADRSLPRDTRPKPAASSALCMIPRSTSTWAWNLSVASAPYTD